MKVKVCGLTDLNQLIAVQEMGADFVGLVFYEGSKRFAGEKLREHRDAVRNLDAVKVGVFVNAPIATIEQAIDDYGLSIVQLHGHETPDDCAALQSRVAVIKAFSIGGESDIDSLVSRYHDACNYYLLDTATKGYGGSGRQFDWSLLEKAVIGKLFFLSGGIGPDDAERFGGHFHSFLYAVDVNSRFETEPGIKDLALLQTFITQLKASDDESEPA
jgi:phosphoribosylanthranilate isomerase